jgi:hypothetical protein
VTTYTPGKVHLVDLAVGDITGKFFVPAYQRGYRWGRAEVEHLLDDISQSTGERYYLQPVVVKAMEDGRWELVDGQQRMTTLYLILSYIKRKVLPSAEVLYSIDYETRPGSPAYLVNPTAELSDSNIDFFHIKEAADAIEDWFGRQHQSVRVALKFYEALAEKVRVIWYEAAAHVDSTTLFTRLNVGRIALTDAELVKALILSRSRSAADTPDRSREIVAQWDAFERDLRSPEVWAFATGSDEEQPTHVSLLLDSLAETDRSSPSFHTFETLREQVEEIGWDEVWKRIVDRHSLVIGWYDDRDLYHKIGFLIATGVSFSKLVELAHEQTKSDFLASLDGLIRDRLRLSSDDLQALDYGTSDQNKKAEWVLLLMNVETVRRTEGSSERFSFSKYAAGSWSLEHIHAQSSATMKAEQQRQWLCLHRDALGSLQDLDDDARADLLARIDAARADISQEVFDPLKRELLELFSETDEDDAASMHAISNLALLDRDDNSALNNGAFEVKRRAIIKLDMAGSYIPVCTRNVFLKYYTRAQGQQLHFWGALDREGYLKNLLEKVGPYLLVTEEDEA